MNVDGESPASMRMMQTAETAEDKPEFGEVGGVWIVGNVEEIKNKERARE